MLKGIAIGSGNDASVAMAEHIAGSEEEFVKRMNEKAAELGLKDTSFQNTTGLPEEGHYSTAYDMALMAKELLKYENITKFTGTYEDYLRENTDKNSGSSTQTASSNFIQVLMESRPALQMKQSTV